MSKKSISYLENMKKTIIRIICFLALLCTVLWYTNYILKVKYGDGIWGVKKFYELEDNTVDVLILGSSHAFEDFNTGVMWDEHGISSFVLAGSVQPMWNTYYYLKEALKYQKPKLIILEGYCTTLSQEYSDDSRIIKNNFGLRLSKDKFDSIMLSTPEGRHTEFLLGYTQYHSRYTELSMDDFLKGRGNPFYDDWKGFGCNMNTEVRDYVDVSAITEKSDMLPKTEEYYRKTIELAIENDIPIIIMISPYAGISESDQKKYNRAEEIADEYEIPYINWNNYISEIGLDYATDVADVGHLNYRGNQKYTKYVSDYITENYEIPDHRNDDRYVSWKRNADFIRQLIYNQEVTENTEALDLCKSIKNNDKYWVFVSVDGTCSALEPKASKYLDIIGAVSDAKAGIWFIDEGSKVWESGDGTAECFRSTSTHDFHLNRTSDVDGILSNSIVIDNEEYVKVENGINVLVYDNLTEKIVDSFGLNKDNEYEIVR